MEAILSRPQYVKKKSLIPARVYLSWLVPESRGGKSHVCSTGAGSVRYSRTYFRGIKYDWKM